MAAQQSIETWKKQVKDVSAAAQALTATLNEQQMNWQPAGGAWSIAQCFEHLNVTTELYYPRLRDKIRDASAGNPGAPAQFRPGWFARKFIGMIDPASQRPIPTVRVFKPKPVETSANVMERFFGYQETFLEILAAAAAIDINRHKIISPASRMLRFTVGEGLWLQVEHQRRHLLQAQNVTRKAGFPTG